MQKQVQNLPIKSLLEIQQIHEKLINLCSCSNRAYPFIEAMMEQIKKNICITQQLEYQQDQPEWLFKFKEWKYFDMIDNPTPSPICSKSIGHTATKKAFKCYDCGLTDNAIVCYDCFVAGDHKGHSYRQIETVTGGCDCGDSQMWKEKGFCSHHTSKQRQTNIKPQVIKQFMAQQRLLFYCYFELIPKYLGKDNENFEKFGNMLFQTFGQHSEQSYDLKVLSHQLLTNKFKEFNVTKSNQPDLTILQKIFRLSKQNPVFQSARKILFQLSTLQSFKKQVLKQYFRLSKEGCLDLTHPIKKINYQFLVFSKLVCQMIRDGQIQPLRPNAKNQQNVISCYKRYFEDMNYLSKVKASAEYHLLHLQMVDISQMAAYRFAINDQKIASENDHFFIKSLGTYLNSSKHPKHVLLGCIGPLAFTIYGFKGKPAYSMAHQRAFSLLIMAYCQGDLKNLQKQQYIAPLQEILTEKVTLQALLKKLITQSFQSKQMVGFFKQRKIDSHEYFFIAANPQVNFLNFLDIIYQKILLRLCQSSQHYSQIIKSQLMKMETSPISSLWVLFELSYGLCFDVDQAVIAGFLGFHREQITEYLHQITAGQPLRFTAKQFRQLAKGVINNSQIIQNYMEQHLQIYNGKIRLKNQKPLLPSIIHERYLKNHNLLKQLTFNPLLTNPAIKFYQVQSIFTNFVIIFLINQYKKMQQNPLFAIKEKSQSQSVTLDYKQTINQTKEAFDCSLIIIYMITSDQRLKSFFKQLLNQKQKISPLVHQQLVQILQTNQQRQKQNQIENSALKSKKNRMQQKKRQKLALMKKNATTMLEKHEKIIQEEGQRCIYCREKIANEESYLISYFNFTHLISKRILNKVFNHIFFSSCHHIVHQQCYIKYEHQKGTSIRCFLCKQDTNLLIPCISKIADLGKKVEVATQFVQFLYHRILQMYMEKLKFLQEIMDQYKGNMLALLIDSVVRELNYNGLHNDRFITKFMPIYRQLYQILKYIPAKQLQESISIVSNRQVQDHPLQTINKIIFYRIKHKLLPSSIHALVTHTDPNIQNAICKLTQHICKPQAEQINQFSSASEIISANNMLMGLQQNIHKLHLRMQACPFCKKMTHNTFLCVLCGWLCCTKQSQNFFQHVKKQHPQGSIFISPCSGRLAFIFKESATNKESIYENQFGELYTHQMEQQTLGKLQKFKLNKKKSNDLFNCIIEHGVHSRTS